MAKEPLLSADQSELVRKAVEGLRAKHRTQKEIADHVGLSQQTVSKILGGAQVGLHAAKKIADRTRAFDLTALLGTGERPAEPTPMRIYESDRDADRRGSLARVREKLYQRYPKRAVDEAIGSSEFIGAESIDELEAFAFFDDLLRGQRFEERHGRPRLGERPMGDAERILESGGPLIVNEDEDGTLHYSSLPPHEPEGESEAASGEDEENGGKNRRASRKLPRAGKATR